MYIHGEMLLPDYVAIGLLIGNIVFLISLLSYGILKTVKTSYPKKTFSSGETCEKCSARRAMKRGERRFLISVSRSRSESM
jgi:hypothetical protein